MKKLQLLYFVIGGLMLLTTAIAFLYFTLFDYRASGYQWLSAAILGVIGVTFLAVAADTNSVSVTVENKK